MMKLMLLTILFSITARAFGAVPNISPELGKTLEQVQAALAAEQWDEALDALRAFKGEKNAVWYNALGQIYLARKKLPEAEDALREAYRRNSDNQFGLALAVCLKEQDKLAEALRLFGRHTDFAACSQSALEAYLSLASQRGDRRLVQELIRWGLIRFPDSRYVREMDIQQAAASGDAAALVRATDAMLMKEPLEVRWWQSRAAAADSQSGLQLARLEAAVLADPDHTAVRRMHMTAQLAAGHHAEALAQAKLLMQHNTDSKTALYCVQAAIMCEAFETAFEWLEKTEVSDEPAYWRAAAVTALENGAFEKADEALGKMLRFPRPNPSLWRWAAHKAVDAESPLAEKWLLQGLNLDPAYKTPIALDYARWLISEARMKEAADAVRAYREHHPADPAAAALLKLVED